MSFLSVFSLFQNFNSSLHNPSHEVTFNEVKQKASLKKECLVVSHALFGQVTYIKEKWDQSRVAFGFFVSVDATREKGLVTFIFKFDLSLLNETNYERAHPASSQL